MKKQERDDEAKLLRGVDFFSPFTDDEIDDLLDIASLKRFVLNEVIIAQSAKEWSFYIIVEGAAKIVKGSIPEDMHELAILTAGDCFGEIAMLLNEPRTASVLSGVKCTLFEIEGERIDSMSARLQSKIYRQFAVNLARRLVFASI